MWYRLDLPFVCFNLYGQSFRERLMKSNSLGNDQWDWEIGNSYVDNSKICSSPFEHPYLFWAGWPPNVLIGQKRELAQEIRLGSPDRFSSWEGGVFQLLELVSDCHSVCQQPREPKIFDFFAARVVQKVYSGNGLFGLPADNIDGETKCTKI